jgi:hypothetical protein
VGAGTGSNASRVTRLILAYTPYHVLLATAAILAESEAAANHLVIIDDFEAATRMAAVLKESGGLYRSVRVRGGTFGVTSRARRQLRYRKALPIIAQDTRELMPGQIWIGNDARPESQVAFRTAVRQFGQVEGVFIEDGLTAYAASVKRPLTKVEDVLGYLLFGSSWAGIEVLGTSEWISSGLFVYPALVRNELTNLPKRQIPRSAFFAPVMHRFAAQMVSSAGADLGRVRRLDAVVTISHSSVASRSLNYKDSIMALVRQLTETQCVVGIKYHPRQAEADYLGLVREERTVLLPQGLPLEFVYILRAGSAEEAIEGQLRFVVGDVSTTLLTARWLATDARCISLARPLGLLDPSLETLFERLGVELPASLEQVW